jgi:hypothetical protein
MNNFLLGQLEEFKSWAIKEFEELHADQKEILSQLQHMNKDRWIAYGKMTVINGILICIIEIFAHIIF